MSVVDTSQLAGHLLMIRPACFGANPETGDSNAFQWPRDIPAATLQQQAVEEFDAAVACLERSGIAVLVEADTPWPAKSDAVFPNNWFSTHANGLVVTYPMMSVNRRQEVRPDIIHRLGQRFCINEHWALDEMAPPDQFLEGTGSLVLDRVRQIAFACLSPRTSPQQVKQFCQRTGYRPHLFEAFDQRQVPVYHTNVMMSVLQNQVVICLDAVRDPQDRRRLAGELERAGKSLLDINQDQMDRFAGNLLQVGRMGQRPALVLSRTALDSLDAGTRQELERESDLVVPEIPLIERYGGGSARCLLAEIHLPEKRG